MKCIYCRGELRMGSVDYSESRNGCDVIFHNLPALVCTQCKEPIFEEQTVEAIQNVLLSVDEKITPLRLNAAA